MPALKDITNAVLRDVVSEQMLSNPTLAIGSTTKALVKNTTAFSYALDNIIKTVAIGETAFTDLTVQPVLTTCYYALWVDSAGTTSLTNGTPMLTTSITSTNYPVLPANQDDKQLVGAVKIVLASTATFTPATTLLDAANLTATYYNTLRYPTTGVPGDI
jgi:hypothetical protein